MDSEKKEEKEQKPVPKKKKRPVPSYLNRKQLRRLFRGALLEVLCIAAAVYFSFTTGGALPWYFGMAGIVLMAGAFAGAVYGWYDMKNLRQSKDRLAILGVLIHTLDFLILLAWYLIGIFIE